jgi:hypothetical protein
MGTNPLDDIEDDDIILGIKPDLESALYSTSELKNYGLRYGLVYKNSTYDPIIQEIGSQMRRHVGDTFTVSINRQKSLEDYIFKVSGKVLQQQGVANEYSKGASIRGIKYSTPDLYDADYYNDIIIPTKTVTVADKNNSTIISDDPTSQNPDPEEIRLITEVKDIEKYTYKYYGSDPLVKKVTKTTYLKLPYAIDKNNFRIVAFTDINNNITGIYICNYIG